MVFIHIEKAHNKVPIKVLWKCLETKGVEIIYIQVIKEMSDGGRTSVRKSRGDADDPY